jgi:hypothetical protein
MKVAYLKPHTKLYLVRVKAQWSEDGGRIMLGDKTVMEWSFWDLHKCNCCIHQQVSVLTALQSCCKQVCFVIPQNNCAATYITHLDWSCLKISALSTYRITIHSLRNSSSQNFPASQKSLHCRCRKMGSKVKILNKKNLISCGQIF